MEHCNGCDRVVPSPIRLDSHCNLPYCKNCVIKLGNDYETGKVYSNKFENPDARKCDRCEIVFEMGYIVRHTGKFNYECTFCEPCIVYFGRLIQDLIKN